MFFFFSFKHTMRFMFRDFLAENFLAHTFFFEDLMAGNFLAGDFLAEDFLAHHVTFRDFMAGNFFAGVFLGWIRFQKCVRGYVCILKCSLFSSLQCIRCSKP